MPHVRIVVPEASNHHRHDAHPHRAAAAHHRHQPHKPRVEPPDFRFCIELGLVIRSRRRDHATVTGLEGELNRELTRAGVANHIANSRLSPVSSREWTIAADLTIPSRPRDHRFGMKLVSPFMRFSRRPDNWQAELRALFRALDAHFELTTSHQCFTHVHITPDAGFWELGQAKALAKSALYFERCLDTIVPPYRRRSVWVKSNRNNRYFLGLSMAECFDRIDAQSTFEGLGARMNWCSSASATGLALGAKPGADFQHETYRWNFANLNEGGGFGTVEFRQPPGSTSAAEVVGWVMLVGCLARLSCGAGGELKPGQKPQLKSLGEWLVYEAEWCGMPQKSPLRDLIKQAVPDMPAPGKLAGMDADDITFDEEQRLRWKDTDRNIALDKYRRLLKHVL